MYSARKNRVAENSDVSAARYCYIFGSGTVTQLQDWSHRRQQRYNDKNDTLWGHAFTGDCAAVEALRVFLISRLGHHSEAITAWKTYYAKIPSVSLEFVSRKSARLTDILERKQRVKSFQNSNCRWVRSRSWRRLWFHRWNGNLLAKLH